MIERRTIGQTKEALEFMTQVDSLSQQQRDHLRIVVKKLIECYLQDNTHGVLVVGKDDEEQASLLTINCDEMEAAVTLSKLQSLFTQMNMDGAPPKEMMN